MEDTNVLLMQEADLASAKKNRIDALLQELEDLRKNTREDAIIADLRSLGWKRPRKTKTK